MYSFTACRRADGKGSVALLPRESLHAHLILNPRIGCLLYLPHHVREPASDLHPGEHVNMIRHTADALAESVQAIDDAAEVFMQPRPPSGIQPRLAVLCAKDDVVVQTGVGAGHGRR